MHTKKTDRSGNRFRLSEGPPRTLLDTKNGKEYHLPANEGGEETTLVSSLVDVANRRHGDFDPLFNSLDALDALFIFAKRRFPALLESGILQPTADLIAALHDRVVGGKPKLFQRDGFDGSYRHREDYPKTAPTDPSASKKRHRPQRTHANLLEGLTVLGYEALRRGHGKAEAHGLMASMLRDAKIGLRDGKPGTGVDVKTAMSWHRSVTEGGRRPAAGRAYTWKVLNEQFGARLVGCNDPVEGRRLATEVLQRVHDHESTDWYVPPRQRRSRRANRSG